MNSECVRAVEPSSSLLLASAAAVAGFKATIFMIITKVTEKFMISSSRIVNITLDSKEDEKQSIVYAVVTGMVS